MDVRCEVLMKKVWRGVLGALLAFVFSIVPAFASASPSGWDVQIESYTRGPNYVRMDVSLPDGATGINFYEYEHSYDSGPYNVQRNSALPAQNSDGTYTVFIYNMLGGGVPTFMKMTYDDAAGNESSLPANFFILQLDVAVYLDGISADTLAKLQSALANLEDSAGVGSAVSAGQTLQNGFSSMGGFSGRNSGDLSFSVPIIPGQPPVVLFSSDQLAQLTWLQYVQTALIAGMWILFVIYLIKRFSPIFKV